MSKLLPGSGGINKLSEWDDVIVDKHVHMELEKLQHVVIKLLSSSLHL